MKNTTKISLMSGLVTAGALLCGVHIANAQTNIDTGYTITIPSEVGIDKDSGKGSFSVSGKMDAQTELDVTTTSQNDYKLKCGSQFVDYTLDKQSFHIDNIKSANPKSFNEDFNITLANTNTNYSGPYEDRLTFNIVNNAYTYELDLNSVLDGVNNYSVHDYGTADIYINGEKVADDVSDWGGTVHYGDIYEIKDIKSTTGHHYSGASDGENNLNNFPLKGKIGIDTKHVENSKGILYSSIFLKFDTNTYTVKYDSNGGKGSMADTVHKYYKSDKMDGVTKLRKNTFTKVGYQFQGWYLTRVINKETYYLYDNWQWYKEGSQPSVTKKYLYVNERASSNATTVDKDVLTAIAQWSPITYTITYDANGGTLSTTKTQQFYTGTPYKTPENSKSFSGTSTDDCEDLGYYNYAFGNKLTISTKIRFNSSDDTLPQKLQEFFCNYEWGGFGLGLGEDARPYFSVFRENKDDYDILHSKTKIKPNETYWITGVYDGPNNTMSIYINGEKTNTVQLSTTDNSNIKVSPLGLSLGGNSTGGCQYSNLTKGDIWKCGLWQNALSDEEVMKMYKTDTLVEGSFISRDFSAPKKNYYLFDGWYTQPTGGDKITTGSIIKSSMTLYAHYKPIRSFVNYDSNGGNGTMQSEEFLSSNKTNLSKNTFTKDGYTFKGWLASRIYKSNEEYMYVNPNGGGGWFEKGKQPSGWSKLYLLSDQEAIYMASAYDGLTLTFHAQWEKAYSAGTVLNIEGTEYTVIEQKENSKYLVMMNKSIGKKSFQSTSRSDGQNMNTYEESEIDNYLENEWYNSLSSTMKTAIQTTNIKQASYADWKNPDSKQETGYNGQVYNTISRHIFLPSLSEIGEVVDLKNSNKMKAFLHGVDIWIRDSCQYSDRKAGWLYADGGSLNFYYVFDYGYVRPAFVIDLSKVDYTVTGTVNYK